MVMASLDHGWDGLSLKSADVGGVDPLVVRIVTGAACQPLNSNSVLFKTRVF